jgi:hypothetical protein
MKDHQIEDLKKMLEAVVKETVNGKIDRLSVKLDDYIKEDTAYKAEDKLRTQPVVDAFNNSKWSLKVFIGILKFLALFVPASAGVLLIKKLWN